MKKTILSISIVMSLVMLFSIVFTSCNKKFKYEHNPMDNPYAAADIEVDENAVYGYRPNKTGSLAQWADNDWSDKKTVEDGRKERIAYHKSIESLYALLDQMVAKHYNTEQIARKISDERTELKKKEYENDPVELENAKARNLEKWGHEEEPTADEYYEYYNHSWETVLSKALSTNSGMDACLGLYDDYYSVYVACGQIKA